LDRCIGTLQLHVSHSISKAKVGINLERASFSVSGIKQVGKGVTSVAENPVPCAAYYQRLYHPYAKYGMLGSHEKKIKQELIIHGRSPFPSFKFII